MDSLKAYMQTPREMKDIYSFVFQFLFSDKLCNFESNMMNYGSPIFFIVDGLIKSLIDRKFVVPIPVSFPFFDLTSKRTVILKNRSVGPTTMFANLDLNKYVWNKEAKLYCSKCGFKSWSSAENAHHDKKDCYIFGVKCLRIYI